MFHFIPALWEFHKVHHSAEVLTTFTEMRTHPVEIIAFMNIIGMMTGIVFGVLTYEFGPGVQPFTLLNANLALMLFLLTIGHLRHSHMWLPFTGIYGKLLQSPAHHQIHHSDQERHFDKNLGFALAIWDWAFGTLYVPSKHEKFGFGFGAESSEYDTIAKAFLLPFVRSWGHIRGAFRNAGADAAPTAVRHAAEGRTD
jgi:sterol desaturase/sphingolipid hydroxylase (fatty acid hydroxylase superfamily)